MWESRQRHEVIVPQTTADVFKRDMGSGKEFLLGSKSFTAEELSSFVLRSLKADAEEYLGEPVTEASDQCARLL